MSSPDLTVIIVSWNVCSLLRTCLGSLEQQRDTLSMEVIVVDAASADGSAAMVRADFPWVRLEAQTNNVGFPRGNNIGIRIAAGRYLLLLNPDTEAPAGSLRKMVAHLEAHADVGVLGSQLRFPDGTIQSSRRRFPTLATGFFESTWLQPYAPARVLDRYYMRDVPDDAIADVDWVMGACLMTRRQVIDQVGLLDEEYFMYSEELDWCRRIKSAGWRVVYFPDARIIHHEGKSSEQAVTARHINFQRAKLRYFRKHHGRPACLTLRLFLLAGYGWQLLLEGCKGVLGHKRSLRWQRVGSYWQVLRSGLRPAGY